LKSGGVVDGHVKNGHMPKLGNRHRPRKYKVSARPRQHHAGLRQGNISLVFVTVKSQIGKPRGINKSGPATISFSSLFIAAAFV
jgi:hypothetical protein